MKSTAEMHTTKDSLAPGTGWAADVEQALKTWKGEESSASITRSENADGDSFAEAIETPAVALSVRASGDATGAIVLVVPEEAARAALGIEADAPLGPIIEELLRLLEQRLASAAGRAVQLGIEKEERLADPAAAPIALASFLDPGDHSTARFEVSVSLGGAESFAASVIVSGEWSDAQAPAAAAGERVAPRGAATSSSGATDFGRLGIIMDVELPVVVRLGEAELPLEEILELRAGSIIELNKQVDEPAELIVNNKVIAYGEVVVVQERFGLRITRLAEPASEGLGILS